MTALTLISGVVTNLQQFDRRSMFTCTVNGVQLSGSMGYTGVSEAMLNNRKNDSSYDILDNCEPGIEEGDTVDFVVRQAEGYMYIEAARSPKHRLIWMPEEMTGGGCTRKHHNTTWKNSLLGLYLVITPLFIFVYHHFRSAGEGWIFSTFAVFLPVVLLEGIKYKVEYNERKEATDVMRALGYENPEHVDLEAISKEKCQQYRAETGVNIYLAEWAFRY